VAEEKNCEVLRVSVSTLSGGGGGVGETGDGDEPPLQPARMSARQGTAQRKGLVVPTIITKRLKGYDSVIARDRASE